MPSTPTLSPPHRAPLPASAIFYGEPEGSEYAPGWTTPDPSGEWLTPGHVDAATFESRIRPDSDGSRTRIYLTSIRHEWLVLSHHDKDCPPPGPGDDDDPAYCCAQVDTGFLDEDSETVYAEPTNADTPGAIAVTWGLPIVPLMIDTVIPAGGAYKIQTIVWDLNP